jgi:hypothetical protein
VIATAARCARRGRGRDDHFYNINADWRPAAGARAGCDALLFLTDVPACSTRETQRIATLTPPALREPARRRDPRRDDPQVEAARRRAALPACAGQDRPGGRRRRVLRALRRTIGRTFRRGRL